MVSEDAQQAFSEELLGLYYSRLFPYEAMTRWLSYGNDANAKGDNPHNDRDYLKRREVSFTLKDDIYIRYLCFRDAEELKLNMTKKRPYKIDIGAVYTLPPKEHATVKPEAFKPVERELVFDIDLTDYDAVRVCCTGAKICPKCWTYMIMAIKVLDKGIREDFGFKQLLWIYSGRRGVHCWVCDEGARNLTNEARTAVAQWFGSVMSNAGTEEKGKKVNIANPIHPSLVRAYNILEPLFRQYILPGEGQGLLATPERWSELLNTVPYEGIKDEMSTKWLMDTQEPEERWYQLVRAMEVRHRRMSGNGCGGGMGSTRKKPRAVETMITPQQWIYETIFEHCYPRIDINVSTHQQLIPEPIQNHLLKSPFAVHPKTGRVCVPIDPKRCETFNPFSVPTLGNLENDINNGATIPTNTSLGPYIEAFEKDFLKPLLVTTRKQIRDEADRMAAATISF